MKPSLMILLAGPYRSGTGDDPLKMAANLAALEAVALTLWQRGHLPVIGEWLALPLIRRAGSTTVGDPIWQALGYPVADRLLEHCDAVLRLPGESKGADGDVALARSRGLPVYTDLSQIEPGQPQPGRPS